MIIYLSCLLLFLIGLYCVAVKKNLIKIIIGLLVMEYAVNLCWVALGYHDGRIDYTAQMAVLASITIGLAITIVTVAVAMRVYSRYGTFDVSKLRKLQG